MAATSITYAINKGNYILDSHLIVKKENDMKFTKLNDKGILLTPQTAAEENFIYYLGEMIEAKEAKFLNNHALELQSSVQDSQPLIIGSQP